MVISIHNTYWNSYLLVMGKVAPAYGFLLIVFLLKIG